jgi:hypothetical protein
MLVCRGTADVELSPGKDRRLTDVDDFAGLGAKIMLKSGAKGNTTE